MKKLIAIIPAMMLIFVANTGMAQDDFGFDPGDYEVTMQGSGTSDDDLDNTTLSMEGSFGYFLTDLLEIGVRQGISYADIEGASDNFSGSTRGFLDLHFDLTRFQPFIGINLGYLYGDEVNETAIGGLEAGLKYFFVPSTFLYGLAEYNFTFDSADEIDEAFDDGRFVYALGLGYKW
ncbi:MAG: hypothetical protein ACLFV2_07385 [Desulfurivibrionaceae bacterium]